MNVVQRLCQWERGSLDLLHQVCTMQLDEMCTFRSESGFPGEPEAACYTACQEEDGVSWVLHVLYYLGGVAKSFAAQRRDGLGSGTCCRLTRWLWWAVWRTPCADQSALERQPRVRFCSLFPLFMTGKGNETTNTEENKLSLVFHSGRSIT